jgi:hypothetical protein
MRRAWKALTPAIAGCLGAAPAFASFELLPGPVSGGLADGMTRAVWDSSNRGTRVNLAVTRPADVPELAGAHAAIAGSIRGRFLAAEIYRFQLADLYGETVLGMWGGGRILCVGVRRWQAGWSTAEERAGWTFTTFAQLRYRGVRLTPGVQDAALAKDRPAAPPRRWGARVDLRVGTDLELGLDLWSARDRGVDGRVRWSPARDLVLSQQIRLPHAELTSGVEIRIARLSWSFWFSPSSTLGERIAASTTFRFGDDPRP